MFATVILSKNPDNLIPCIKALGRHDPGTIFVVDDGIPDLTRVYEESGAPNIHFLRGQKPFVFSRNANIGLRAVFQCGYDAAVLLNDDALLTTPGGFTALYNTAVKHPHMGLVASNCNNVGNENQMPRFKADGVFRNAIRPEKRMLCFVCVLIPRQVYEQVGPLDERFVGYGHDDDDYCLRVRNAGYDLGVFDGCFVDHGSLKSTFRGDEYPVDGFELGKRLFQEKWGEAR